jgi:hypothetical protein
MRTVERCQACDQPAAVLMQGRCGCGHVSIAALCDWHAANARSPHSTAYCGQCRKTGYCGQYRKDVGRACWVTAQPVDCDPSNHQEPQARPEPPADNSGWQMTSIGP